MGDARVRGVSGGEKKRLSLACELIASPSIIFADEPTTGKHDLVLRLVSLTIQFLSIFWAILPMDVLAS